MMSKKKIKYGLTAAILGVLLLLAGCKSDVELKLTTGLNQGDLFRIENEVCTEAEARLFLMNQKNHYEASYGGHIWDVPVKGEKFADYMKDQLKSFLIRFKSMILMAEDRHISLSDEEKNMAASAAQEYMAGLSEEAAAYIGMTEEQITKLYQEYRLADRLVSQVTAAVNTEISDDEARVIEVQQIVFPRTKTGEDGETVRLSDGEDAALRNMAQDVAGRAAEGDAFSNLQQIYSGGTEGSIQVSRYDVDDAWEEAVFSLGSGEISGLIETEEAYYVVRCVNNMLTEETLENKEIIRERQRAEVFYREYYAFTAGLTSQHNDEAWQKLSFRGDIPECEADFYAIYDTYFE